MLYIVDPSTVSPHPGRQESGVNDMFSYAQNNAMRKASFYFMENDRNTEKKKTPPRVSLDPLYDSTDKYLRSSKPAIRANEFIST